MNWIDSGQFKIADRNGRHYVFRRSNAGNTEINIPASIITKGHAKKWLKNNPNKVTNPTRHKPLVGIRQPGMKQFERIINGKKMIGFVNKDGKPYYLPAGKKPIVLTPKPSNMVFKCNTNFFKRVRNSNGATGFKATALANHNKLYTVPSGKMSMKKGMAQLGKGTQGVVFLAYTSPKGTYPVTIKVIPHDKTIKQQTADIEFDIQKKLYALVPGNIPEPYAITHDCKGFIPVSSWKNNSKKNIFDYTKQTVVFSEYINGGSLPDWMNRMSTRLSDNFMQSLISQVLHTLLFIGKRIPTFRHNDLHLDNILVKQNSWTKFPTFILNDFGWAYMGKGTNPLVDSAKHAGKFGIGPKTSSRYDMHLFLNELHKWIQGHGGKDKYTKTMAFIEKHLPAGYLGSNNMYINESRLKYGSALPGLNSLSDIIKDKYVHSPRNYIKNVINVKNYQNKKRALHAANNIEKTYIKATPRTRAIIKNILSARRTKSVSPRTPANLGPNLPRVHRGRKRSAPRPVAKNITPKKINFDNINMNVSPRSFLKLSPTSRARVMAIRKAGGAKPKTQFLIIPKPPAPKPKTPPKSPTANRNAKLSKSMLKSNKFNSLRVRMLSPGRNENYYNRWDRAKQKAVNIVTNRLRRGLPAFTPSPPKPHRFPSPPKPPRVFSPSKPKPTGVSKIARRVAYKVKFESNGRMKIAGNSGRAAFVNGMAVSMELLRTIAARYGVDITGLRKKTEIANKIFRNNK